MCDTKTPCFTAVCHMLFDWMLNFRDAHCAHTVHNVTRVLCSRRAVVPVFPHSTNWFTCYPPSLSLLLFLKLLITIYSDTLIMEKCQTAPASFPEKTTTVALMWIHFPETLRTSKRGVKRWKWLFNRFVFFADVALRGLHGPLQGLLSKLAPPGSVEHYCILEQFH